MNLREDYKKEKGKWANVVCSDTEGNTYFTDDYVEWLEEKLVKNCSIPDVSQQRELLIAYHKHNTMIRNEELDKFIENYVDDYLSNL